MYVGSGYGSTCVYILIIYASVQVSALPSGFRELGPQLISVIMKNNAVKVYPFSFIAGV